MPFRNDTGDKHKPKTLVRSLHRHKLRYDENSRGNSAYRAAVVRDNVGTYVETPQEDRRTPR